MNDISGKYITISGLQGFYTGLKNTYQPTLTATAASAKQAPPHTSAVSAAIHTVTTAAAAAAAIGVAAQEYAEDFDENDNEEHIRKEIARYIMNDGDLCSDLAGLITERIFMINVGK